MVSEEKGPTQPKRGASEDRTPEWRRRLAEATGKDIDVRERAERRRRPDLRATVVFRCSRNRTGYTLEFTADGDQPERWVYIGVAQEGRGRAERVLGDEETAPRRMNLESIANRKEIVCPQCGDAAIVLCGACMKLSCGGLGQDSLLHTCPWCGQKGAPEPGLEAVDGVSRKRRGKRVSAPRADGVLKATTDA